MKFSNSVTTNSLKEAERLFNASFIGSLKKAFSLLEEFSQGEKTFFIIILLLFLLEGAQVSVTGETTWKSLTKKEVFGPPLPLKNKSIKNYHFTQVGKPFAANMPLWRLEEFDKQDLRRLILESTPIGLRSSLEKYVDTALKYAEKYQVDPFWVLSIMWVESHFQKDVRSYVNAMGLMQIMPATGHFLNIMLKRKIDINLAYELSKNPEHNIQLGTYYLKRLLKRYRGSYRLATVAYNMGPGNIKKRLKKGLAVGVRNNYLDKVRTAYGFLSKETILYLKRNAPSYATTYVVNKRWGQEMLEMEMILSWLDLDMMEDLAYYAVSTDGQILI